MDTNCTSSVKSLRWCKGKTSKPGLRDKVYYVAKSDIAIWPIYNPETGKLEGSFKLVSDPQNPGTTKKWSTIDVLPNKSSFKSESQGEYPSVTQKNTLEAIYPGCNAEANIAVGKLNNNDTVVIAQGADKIYRVIGNEDYPTNATAAQDLGQGETGSTSTTLTFTTTDVVPAPIYEGEIDTEDGIINPDESGSGSASE